MKRKICVITGSRAEYGLLQGLMKQIRESSSLTLQIIATGMHLSPEFGLTANEIEKDGFEINKKIENLLSGNTPSSISKAIGLGIIGISDALNDLKPDIVVVLGDRFEILAGATAALIAKIPLAHIHGGESTEGAIDEAIRHSITKMSQLHFVAAEPYRNRVIQLGEDPSKIFLVGGLGVDLIQASSLLSRDDLEKSLNFNFGEKSLLVTFHPATLDSESADHQIRELLSALNHFPEIHLIFTLPNADSGSRDIFRRITEFMTNRKNAIALKSMGQLRYLSSLQFVNGVIGNSSSGLAEVPSFKKGTINIGDRQKGRLKAMSVIDCEARENSIVTAIEKLYSHRFQSQLPLAINPYGNGGATAKIFSVLLNFPLNNIMKKSFFDIPQVDHEGPS